MANLNLNRAKKLKNDEFYTQRSDVEQELKHYTKHFKDKIIYCNCDDPTESNFWRYFYRSFAYLGLKKLISTHYEMDGNSSYALIYEGGHDNAENFDEGVTKVPLKDNGDFRSDECIEYLKESDIVVTNPPFSLAREYIKQIMDYKKKFLVIGNKNWITYKEIFPLLMNHDMWIGVNSVKAFKQPDGSFKKFGNVGWFTNLSLQKSTDQMVIWKSFDQKEYPAYDNYAAFEVSKVVDIPKDTEIMATINKDNLQGWQDTYKDDLTILSTDKKTVIVKVTRPIWGVPITFMDKYNPSSTIKQHNLAEEFDILNTTTAVNNPFNLCVDYSKYKGIRQDGTLNGRTGSTFGNCPVIRMDDHKHVYYESPDKIRVQAVYKRILIRAKEGVKF